jgi:methionyl-tRNA formyltransferase
MRIQILIDNQNSWMVPFATQWVHQLNNDGVTCVLIHEHNEVTSGDILCLLSCDKKFISLHLNQYNIVVHESDLPKGRGMSPLTWQVIEGKNEIPVTLIEANEKIDAGFIYGQTLLKLVGTELVDELRMLQAKATFDLINDFIKKYPSIKGVEQVGEPTFYPRRTQANSRLDINDTIANQFNLLRVVDNERYPAWFEINGTQYELKISKKSS